MDPKYQTIFMLLTVYMPPNMSPHKVAEWLAVTCKEEIDFIEKAVEDLWQKAFIEEIKPKFRIHDLYMEFAQSKTRKMGRWLWCKRDLIISEAEGSLFSGDEGRFELAKLEHCQHQDLSLIGDRYVKNLWALQVAGNEISNLRLSSMKNIRSLILHNCEYLDVLEGMENLPYLAWLQIVNAPKLKVLNLSSLTALQYIEINTCGPTELGDLTGCISLREIYVRCSSLWEFPGIHGLPNLEKARFKSCDEVMGPLDCGACVKLQSLVFEHCWQMAYIPLIEGCSSLSKVVLNGCYQVTECSEIVKLFISSEDASAPRHSECCDGLKNIPLWNIVLSKDVPSLTLFPNLTVLKLYNCHIREPLDVSVRDPPDIGKCYYLQVFHLLYNDNMEGLPKMGGCKRLDEIKLSWKTDEVHYYSHSYEYDDLEYCPDNQQDEIFRSIDDVFIPAELKELQWIQSKKVRMQQYFCGEKVYYSITAPYESCHGRVAHEPVIVQRSSAISGKFLITNYICLN
ncbi:hypothetical protein SUGI_0960130 [Cryptomeria japonica]|nr:hypothetical protein SUGI_0960130 [Cryptomeria japonica]